MINREQIPVVIHYYDGEDEYGQMLATETGNKQIEGAFGILSQYNTTDVRYIDATHYLLTTDKTITDKCTLTIQDHEYKVKYVNPHKRLCEVFLCW